MLRTEPVCIFTLAVKNSAAAVWQSDICLYLMLCTMHMKSLAVGK